MGDSAKPSNIKIPGKDLAKMLNNTDQLGTIAPLIANVVENIEDELINKIQELFIDSSNESLKKALTELQTELNSFYKSPESPRPPRAGDGLGPAPIPFTGNEKPFLKEQGPDDSKMYKAMAEGGGGRKRRKSKKRNYYKKRKTSKYR